MTGYTSKKIMLTLKYQCWDKVVLSQELSLMAQESKQGCYNLIIYVTSFSNISYLGHLKKVQGKDMKGDLM